MKIYRQLFYILFCSFLGEGISVLLKLPIPGSVLGMLFLFSLLQSKLLKVSDVEEVGNFLLANMTILFLPAGVGIMAHFELLQKKWWQITLIILILLTVNIFFVGKITEWVKVKFEGDYKGEINE
ncbi:MAG: CidA/LrgA family protein [Streptococcaceae bacterium]|jgi:holin-like protein|nr:CidA/LrgA family protein [Streptococcaceae bacterium]